MRAIAIFGAALVLVGVALGACGRSVTSRYKLALTVETPEGEKTASGVYEAYAPESGPSRIRGEAIYLDLGSGRRPLIVLLTAKNANGGKDVRQITWSDDAGPMTDFVLRLYGDPGSSASKSRDKFIEDRQRRARYRGPRSIAPKDLPDLVTFADINDPKSVMLVDPNYLEGALGAGVKWKTITLEVTDEAVTTGVATKLPWLDSYRNKGLGGKSGNYRLDGSLADTLNVSDFRF